MSAAFDECVIAGTTIRLPIIHPCVQTHPTILKSVDGRERPALTIMQLPGRILWTRDARLALATAPPAWPRPRRYFFERPKILDGLTLGWIRHARVTVGASHTGRSACEQVVHFSFSACCTCDSRTR